MRMADKWAQETEWTPVASEGVSSLAQDYLDRHSQAFASGSG